MILEHKNFTYEGPYVLEDGEPVFNIGVVRDAQELRAVITAWRIGRNAGEKTGRVLMQIEIARVLGLAKAEDGR